MVREREELRMTSVSHQRCRRKTGVTMAKEVKEDWSIALDFRERLSKIKIKQHHLYSSVKRLQGDLCRKVAEE